jgi:hypothetical protein
MFACPHQTVLYQSRSKQGANLGGIPCLQHFTRQRLCLHTGESPNTRFDALQITSAHNKNTGTYPLQQNHYEIFSSWRSQNFCLQSP